MPRETLSGGVTSTPLVPRLVFQAPAKANADTTTLSTIINTYNANENVASKCDLVHIRQTLSNEVQFEISVFWEFRIWNFVKAGNHKTLTISKTKGSVHVVRTTLQS